MLRSVLVPTDLSEECGRVIDFVAGLPKLGVERAVIAHVVDTTGMEAPLVATKVDRMREKLRDACGPLAATKLDVEMRVPCGHPESELLALASETGVDAIAAGSHGKTVMDQLFEGSVSETIMREATRPTMLVRFDLLRNHEPQALASGFGRSVLLPTDFSASSQRAFDLLMSLPKGAVGTLYLMHVLDPSLSGERASKAEDGADFQLHNLVEIAKSNGVTATAVIRKGDPQRAVLHELGERRLSGVVAGTRGRNPLQKALLGSVSMTLFQQASTPVLIVP